MKTMLIPAIALFTLLVSCQKEEIGTQASSQTEEPNLRLSALDILYTMPNESKQHEGTWLQCHISINMAILTVTD